MDYVLTVIELTLFVVAVIIAIFSWKAAIKSVHEATKARHDMFSPAIISPISSSSEFSADNADSVEFYFKNYGHGIAIQPEVFLVDTTNKDIKAQFGGLTQRLEILGNFMDYKFDEGRGVHVYRFNLTKPYIHRILNSRVELKILYRDIFERQIKTTYSLTLKEEESKYRFNFNNCKIHLP